MRLFAKFFLCATLVISVALLLSGYLLITFSHESAVNRELERALTQFQFDKFTLQVRLISHTGGPEAPPAFGTWAADLSGRSAFFGPGGALLYSNLPHGADFSLLGRLTGTARAYHLQTLGGESYILVGGQIAQDELYMVVATNISSLQAQREQMMHNFVRVYFTTLALGMVIIFLLSALITRPIKGMNKAAALIAGGNYSRRLPAAGGDEIGSLAVSFNQMADAIEDKIHQLTENARQKEDFVASFAHELKTPLTSVIGYADMLYQKNLTPEQAREAAWYILTEGLRLESLSLKLMDLIVLGRQSFTMEKICARELLNNIAGSIKPILDERNIALKINAAPADILVEYDLFKTLLLNLTDNAVKAGCSTIELTGTKTPSRYSISVADNGRGIPEAELARITEAFYTVDKSRSSRSTGLGLALCARIAELHGSRLEFSSAVGAGTSVRITL